MTKTILSLCDYSGNWPYFYKKYGYNVVQVDLKLGQDVQLMKLTDLPQDVWGILAAPPCTHLAVSGARWWANKGEGALKESLALVDACLRIVLLTQPKWWALENPIGRLSHYLGKPRFIFQPHWYGDPYTKATCLWGNFTIPDRDYFEKWYVEPTEGSKMHLKYGGKSERTKTARSKTPMGFAEAFFMVNP